MVSVLNTLGVGSGVDTTALIDALVAAERGPRETALTARTTRTDARISGLAQVGSGINALVSALASRTRGGALGPLPASSDTAVVAASATRGVTPLLNPATLEVVALARGQTLVSAPITGSAAPVGIGVLTLRTGTMTADGQGGFAFAGGDAAPIEVTIGAENNTLAGLRDAINAAQVGVATPVAASVVTDASGARLVLKGPSGAAQAFIMTADASPGDAGLERFVHNPSASAMTTAATARDASLVLDGVALSRPTNTISDLIDGVTLDLRGVAPGRPVTIAVTRDGDGLKSATRDLVTALNAINSLTTDLVRQATGDATAGPLAGDGTMRGVRTALTALTATPIISGSTPAPTRLADLGIVTGRDGNLTIDEGRLAAAVAASPDAIERILVGLTEAGGPLTRIGASLTGSTVTGAASRYRREQSATVRDRAALETRMSSYRATLVKQYAAMERAVSASKSTQSFLDAQIKAWNRTDS